MAQGNAARCIANTMVYEGGFTQDRNDPGNWTGGKVGVGTLKGTNFGIAANTYPNLNIRALTKSEAIAIYERDWWPKVAGDALPKGVDQVTYDGAVNSGPARGLRWTGEAAGMSGPYTAASVARAAAAYPDKAALVKKACAKRMGFLRGLGTFARYGKGWSSRVAAMEALGIKMVAEAKGLAPAQVKEELKAEKTAATKQSNKEAAKTTGTVAADVGAHQGTTQVADTSSWDWVWTAALWIVIVAGLCVAAYFVWRWYVHRERAQAYEAVAEGTNGLE